MARESAGATLVVMTDEHDQGHRATSRLYRSRRLRKSASTVTQIRRLLAATEINEPIGADRPVADIRRAKLAVRNLKFETSTSGLSFRLSKRSTSSDLKPYAREKNSFPSHGIHALFKALLSE
jgi:hypothetical protein